ncbi:MAG TPA: NAD(P)H-binding protein [Ktedonosporobacter sp.]|nr:NAD(P)H-binding protein [Ktedonosporobacter sp.]
MILVTGATGNVGREVVNMLLTSGERVVALTRHPDKAVLPDSAVVVGYDPSHPQELSKMLHNANAILISPRALGDATAGAATAELLAIAAQQGTPRVVVLSAATVEYGGGYKRFAAAFEAVEEAARTSGLPWTFLRSTDYASNSMAWVPQIRATGIVRGAYGDGATATIHERDVAAVAALALVGAVHAGHSYVLTGPQPLSQRDKVRLIGEAIGRDVHWEELSPEQAKAAMLAQGLPADIPDRLLGYWSTIGQRTEPSTTMVQQILGRPALTFAQWAAEHAAAFRN